MNLEGRQRWDFRTGLYYYVIKPAEAEEMGLVVPVGAIDHIRLYGNCTAIHMKPLKVENPRTMYKVTGLENK